MRFIYKDLHCHHNTPPNLNQNGPIIILRGQSRVSVGGWVSQSTESTNNF